MTKLWPYEVGAKTGDCSNVATLRTNVATLQKQSIPTSRRSGLVLGGLLAHFEPIMEGFKAQTVGIEEGTIWNSFFLTFLRENKLLLGGNT